MINVNEEIKAKFTSIIQDEEPEKWLELRKTGIGGSDAGAILGLNKYASPLTVYMQKKGVEGFEGNNSTEWGHILEDPIRQKAAKELDIEISTVPGMYTSIDYPFMNANLDGLCYASHQVNIGGESVEGLGGYEIKTSTNGDGFTDDEIPDSYYCQVQHYMCVTGLKWFILTAFFFNTKDAKHYIIKRNDDFIYEKLIPKEKEFWENFVCKNNPPEPIGVDSESEYTKSLPLDEEIKLDEVTEKLLEKKLLLDSQIKDLSNESDRIKNEILINLSKLSLGFDKAEKTTAIGSNYKLTYNSQVRKSINSFELKKDGLYDKYCKESVSKVMRISEV